MSVPERFQLFFGPYEPPRIPPSGVIFCEMRGYVRVSTHWSDGPIPWPRRWRTVGIILCGDLVRAVQLESVDAVCHHWGVCRNVVQNWRKALNVPELNPGTQRLLDLARNHLNREARARATLRANDARAVLKRELPPHERAHPLVRPATSELVKERLARTKNHVNPKLRLWTSEEERLLGTASDQAVARQLNRTARAIQTRRNQLGVRAFTYHYQRPWTPEEDALLGVVPDRELAPRINRPFTAVQARRELKGLPPVAPLCHRYTPEENALMGTLSDEDAALRIGVSVEAARAHREAIHIPIYNAQE